MTAPLRVLSLGAGVQSTTVALMSADGDLPTLDCCIFADTGWEPAAVYGHLDWLEGRLRTAGIPVYRVSAGNIRDLTLQRALGDEGVGARKRMASMPFHLRAKDGRPGMLGRQCTSEFKVEPIRRKIAELIGRRYRAGAVEQWFGISLEESQRMRDSNVRYIVNRYPLVERRMRRRDCLHWLAASEYPQPPKSACIGCPFHNDAYWSAMKHGAPDEFADAVDFDERIRHLPRIEGEVFLHRQLIPLDAVDLRTRTERGEQSFLEECEGLCGV